MFHSSLSPINQRNICCLLNYVKVCLFVIYTLPDNNISYILVRIVVCWYSADNQLLVVVCWTLWFRFVPLRNGEFCLSMLVFNTGMCIGILVCISNFGFLILFVFGLLNFGFDALFSYLCVQIDNENWGIPPSCMKERIYQIMKESGMNQKEFSQTTGIAPATLSSIFNGRTSATLNHAQALHQRFPNLRMEWLMFGEGQMYHEGSSSSILEDGNLTQSAEVSLEEFPVEFVSSSQIGDGEAEETERGAAFSALSQVRPALNRMSEKLEEMGKFLDRPQRKVIEVRIYFDDGTYEVFSGPAT